MISVAKYEDCLLLLLQLTTWTP